MAELKTRIQLKYDSLANWTTNDPTLKSGELAIAYLANSHTTTTPDNGTHAVLFKVGPGKFSTLPWASALAADVHSWAKLTEAQFIDGFLAMKDSSGATIQSKLDGIFATDQALTEAIAAVRKEITELSVSALEARVKAIEDDYLVAADIANMATDAEVAAAVKEEADRAKGVEAELDAAIKAIDFVDPTELATALNPYAKSADVASTYETIANATLIRNRVSALEEHKDDYKAYADQAEADAIAAAKTETQNQVKDLSDSIKTHATVNDFAAVMAEVAKKQDSGDYATKTEAKGYADAKDSAIQAAQKTADDVTAAFNAFMKGTGDNTEDVVDTLIEIQQYMTDDTNAFTGLSERVTKLENGTVAAKVASGLDAAGIAQVEGIKVNNAAAADVAAKASGLDASGEAAVKAVKVDNAVNADKLGNAAAADYLKKADAPGYADILTKTSAATLYQPVGEYASAAQGAKADTAVQPAALNDYYTKTQADAEFMNSAETGSAIDAKISALNLATTYEPIGAETRAKAYADGLAGNYATAAQGAKADSALQEITTTAGEGLKVTNKNKIDIDTDVVFVFNCGDSKTLVD